MIREDFFRIVRDELGCEPDYPFMGDFVTAVFRRPDNLKWFAIVMTVDSKKLGIGAFGELDIVNLKCSENDRERLSNIENVLPAYHMNKKHWISIILDNQEDFDSELAELTRKSYALAAKTVKKTCVSQKRSRI